MERPPESLRGVDELERDDRLARMLAAHATVVKPITKAGFDETFDFYLAFIKDKVNPCRASGAEDSPSPPK